MAEIIIAKHRNGAVGDVRLSFRGEFVKFQNPDEGMAVPLPGEKSGFVGSKMNASMDPAPQYIPPVDPDPFGPNDPNNLPPF